MMAALGFCKTVLLEQFFDCQYSTGKAIMSFYMAAENSGLSVDMRCWSCLANVYSHAPSVYATSTEAAPGFESMNIIYLTSNECKMTRNQRLYSPSSCCNAANTLFVYISASFEMDSILILLPSASLTPSSTSLSSITSLISRTSCAQ